MNYSLKLKSGIILAIMSSSHHNFRYSNVGFKLTPMLICSVIKLGMRKYLIITLIWTSIIVSKSMKLA